MTQVRPAQLASACYALSGSESQWLAGVAELLRPAMDGGYGVAAWPFTVGEWWPDSSAYVGVGSDVGDAMRKAGSGTSEPLARAFHLGARTKPASQRVGFVNGFGELPSFAPLQVHGIQDFAALTVLDPSGYGLMFAAPHARLLKATGRDTRRMDRLSAHILSAFRLRRYLTHVDAVFAPDGKLLHAEGEAEAPEHRDALREGVRSLDRAWSHRASADPDEALESWHALVSGRWSLVETFESDGRRYLIARRNPPGMPNSDALTPLEGHALVMRAQAVAYKSIAYDLGLSTSVCHQLVTSGMRKLGIRHELELPYLFATLTSSATLQG